MKGYLIDPAAKTITEVHSDGKFDLDEMYKVIDARTIERVQISATDSIWLDEEGMLSPGTPVFALADRRTMRGSPVRLAGKGLVLGEDEEGDNTSATFMPDLLAQLIEWTDLETTGEIGDSTSLETAHGFVFVGGEPILRQRAA